MSGMCRLAIIYIMLVIMIIMNYNVLYSSIFFKLMQILHWGVGRRKCSDSSRVPPKLNTALKLNIIQQTIFQLLYGAIMIIYSADC